MSYARSPTYKSYNKNIYKVFTSARVNLGHQSPDKCNISWNILSKNICWGTWEVTSLPAEPINVISGIQALNQSPFLKTKQNRGLFNEVFGPIEESAI